MRLRTTATTLLVFACLPAWGATVRFEPANPLVGPFPSDALAVPDAAQKTGLRINLPLPACDAQPSVCAELAAANQLDGFSIQPRLRVAFSAPVDVNTLHDGLWYVALDNLTSEEYGLNRTGEAIPVNEIVYDPATNTAYAKPDDILDQHRRYAIVVTDAVRDTAGLPLTAAGDFTACIAASPNPYCAALAQAVAVAGPRLAPRQIVAASVFTTLSATAWMESARASLAGAPAAAVMLPPVGGYRVADFAGIVWHRQVGVNPSRFDDFSFPLDPALLAGVGRVAFGSYQSPNFLNARQSIDPAPTGAAVPLAASSAEIAFTVYLPATPKPPSGYPVAIFGHGLGDSRVGGPTAVAASLAQAGIATIAISAVGHGYGPESTLILVDKTGNRTAVPGGGRGMDLDGDGTIAGEEGCVLPEGGPVLRDCLRQTALDLSQLVRVIRNGVDIDGDGSNALDPARIYYGGQSLGALYGTLFHAIEPDVRAAVLNAGGASVVDIARWSSPAGAAENYVLRFKPVKVNDVPGAIDIQNLLELYDWIGMTGDPMAYAPHLRASTLPGVPIKAALFQIAWGDRTIPNPTSGRLIRAANMREFTWVYRHDLARAVLPSLPVNPHAFMVLFLSPDRDFTAPDLRTAGISLAVQLQMAAFFRAEGAVIPDPNSLVLRGAVRPRPVRDSRVPAGGPELQ